MNEDDLSPYEIFQLSRYGNILNNADPEEENEKTESYPRENEIIFQLQNPE